ncbi:hypothetical protein DPMN_135375 [Dreissena polymorpha]|uniref:Uncharacterized protein n=1 Tax=Dreissena polymorpha TaxID=45954 RepID=A0A9D4FYX7_DREPO|nr:hypothetical protein DPMN_135375 [Dreissena polymorpha]
MYCISEVLIVDVILGCARSQPNDMAARRSQQLSSCHVIVFVLLPDLEEPPVHFFENFTVYPSQGVLRHKADCQIHCFCLTAQQGDEHVKS